MDLCLKKSHLSTLIRCGFKIATICLIKLLGHLICFSKYYEKKMYKNYYLVIRKLHDHILIECTFIFQLVCSHYMFQNYLKKKQNNHT